MRFLLSRVYHAYVEAPTMLHKLMTQYTSMTRRIIVPHLEWASRVRNVHYPKVAVNHISKCAGDGESSCIARRIKMSHFSWVCWVGNIKYPQALWAIRHIGKASGEDNVPGPTCRTVASHFSRSCWILDINHRDARKSQTHIRVIPGNRYSTDRARQKYFPQFSRIRRL